VRLVLTGAAAALMLAVPAGSAQPLRVEAAPGDDAAQASQDRGEIDFSLRWRYEEVSQDVFADQARASTLRSTLGYRTPAWHGISVSVEFEDVHDLGLSDEHANGGAGSLANGVVDRPVIADPELTEINQARLRYQGLEPLTLDVGRMEIPIGDERFVGPVGFRQNHQSFDGLRASLTAIPRTTLLYAYIQNVGRINGGDQGMSSHLLDVPVDLGRWGELAPYGYFLDYDDASSAGLSTVSWGARWSGRVKLGESWSIPLHAQAALQRDVADNPNRVDAGYARIEAALSREGLTFGLGWEVLGGSADGGAFQTPLATLHKFNGWADLFLTTPADGIVDTWATASGKVQAFSFTVTLHDFDSDAGSQSWGSEIDAEIVWTAPWKQLFSLAYATYDAEGFATDTDKLWLTTSYRFHAKL
jgi:hypothetical protein